MIATAVFLAGVFIYPYSWAPGVRNPEMDEKTLCSATFRTSSIRPSTEYTNKLKAIQIREHPEVDCSNGCEEDHVWPIEAGGDPKDSDNLSPQPYCPARTAGTTCFGAREKDKVENYWHKMICEGKMTIDDVELQLPLWKDVYKRQNL